jgi:hypothetical protein
MAAKGLSEKEVSQRVAIFKRFKELLRTQRDRFQTYLDVLDRSRDVIGHGTADELIRHVELEEKIVADIYSIQQVIDPLDKMYRVVLPSEAAVPLAPRAADDDVPSLKAALEGLKREAVARAGRNKELLSRRMAELRSEIKTLRSNPYTKRQQSFSSTLPPGLVDISG